jgi:AAA+ ATPase superfamily predicted ATPase
MGKFIGRKQELKRLLDLFQQERSSIVVIKGRRRIGKSRLAIEFAKSMGCKFIHITGLAPDPEITSQQQLDNFASQLCLQLCIPNVTFKDWSDAFYFCSYHLQESPTLILFDEISWLGDQDPTFVSKIKIWWDLYLSASSNVMLVLCGSVSTWIEDNIINSTALFGRISLILTLQPFSIPESFQYLRLNGYKGSFYDLYKVLAVTGGVPWYLEQISCKYMASENIKQICFTPGGILVEEYSRIVNDLFNKKSITYQKILESLKDGALTLHQIRNAISYVNSGTISIYMEHLITSGFVKKYQQWSLKTGKLGKQSLYSLCDPYVRFYLKYMQPRLEQIKDGRLASMDINTLPGFEIMLSLQMETLLLQNRDLLLKALNISAFDCVQDNPYIQKPIATSKGCQIDYLIQTRNKNLYVCEFKFKLREISLDIIDELRDKIKRLNVPRNQGVVPVLFHIGGVADSVYEKDFFFRVIDLASLFRVEEQETEGALC